MSLLERIEHRLSSRIEGAFRRRIPRRVEPLEVGRTLLSAVTGTSGEYGLAFMPLTNYHYPQPGGS